MKVNWLKLIGLIALDVFVISLVKEVFFSPDFHILTFILDSIIDSFTHFSFLGTLGGLGMLFLMISFFVMAVSFIVFNLKQLKSCFKSNQKGN